MNRQTYETSRPGGGYDPFPTPNQNSPQEKLTTGERKSKFVSEDVDDFQMDAKEAFDAFKDKKFTTFGLALSDAPIGRFLRTQSRNEYVLEHTPGLQMPSGSLGVLSHIEKAATDHKAKNLTLETPIQRISRLQNEVDEVQDFVRTYMHTLNVSEADKATSLKKSQKELGADPQTLLAELNTLKAQLDALMSDEALHKCSAPVEPISGKRDLFDMASKQIDKVLEDMSVLQQTDEQKEVAAAATDTPKVAGKAKKKSAPAAGKGDRKSSDSSKLMTYELYTVPNLESCVENGRIATLEKKLSEVEGAIGVKNWSDTTFMFPDLYSGLRAIGKRLVNLDPNRLEVTARRIQKLGTDIDGLLRRREKLLGVTTSSLEDKQVLEIYEMCEKWRHSSVALPVVIKRLRVLKTLHQEAAAASSRLSVLEAQQTELARLLESTVTNFDALKNNMTDNMAYIRLSIGDLQMSLAQLSGENSQQQEFGTPEENGKAG